MQSSSAQEHTHLGADRGRTILWSLIALGVGIVLGAAMDGGAPDRFEPSSETARTMPQLEDWHGNVKQSDWPTVQ
ncbi:hypothetical protein M3P21_16120 [Ruegeria sp. 2012CJ41-6]|uniref:Uncharacterized protein n=1 Tax=Ruegeria spongiae TaxID=2942209 RepID=A0ABT0Q5B4_9RHOB|nr:hypothetical protein [Ruegeria spongiae]MCL6285059.1 hypothetical protein [Ruegeria spongiae]